MSLPTFTIAHPGWGGESNVAEHGENYGFQMYTRQGNDAVAVAVRTTVEATAYAHLTRDEMLTLLRDLLNGVAKVHREVRDTEPEVAIVEAVNDGLHQVGLVGIIRDDL
jgi:hypothetical protein